MTFFIKCMEPLTVLTIICFDLDALIKRRCLHGGYYELTGELTPKNLVRCLVAVVIKLC